MNDLIDRQKAIETLRRDPMGGLNYDGILKRLPTVKAIPVENIQKLYKSAVEYRDRFKPFSEKWFVANDQAVGIRSVLDLYK